MTQSTKAPQRLPTLTSEERSSQWGIHWHTPVLMTAAFLLGVATAIGHHIFYLGLDGTKIEDKRLAIRAGTAISYLAKTLFAACIGISHRQRIWSTLRNKAISIRAINALFGATVNPFTILELEMVLNAKVSTIMAILSWLLAAAAIIAPGALSVHDKTFAFDQGFNVPQINITGWNDYNAGNIFAKSLFAYEYDPSLDVYSFKGASPITKRLASLVANGGNIIPIPSPCGTNCSYIIEFRAPTLSCQNQEVHGGRLVDRLYGRTERVLSYDVDGLLDPEKPPGNASADICCINYNATLEPVDKNSVDGRLGLRNRLNIISGAYLFRGPPRKPEDIQSVLCTPYSANYTVKIIFTNNAPDFKILNLTLLSPLNEAVQALTQSEVGIGGFDDVPARGLTNGLYDILLGSIAYAQGIEYARGSTNPTIVVNSTSITSTELARTTIPQNRRDALNWAPQLSFTKDFYLAVEEISHNLTISLLSITEDRSPVRARVTQLHLAYTYDQLSLFITYLAAATATLLCLLIGLHSLWSNGIASDISFSTVLVTTRNPTLDHLSEKLCLGSEPLSKNLLNTKLKFGEIWRRIDETGADTTHAGFGTDGEVTALRKGEKYL